ncbi:MAG: HAD family phosphatase [Candidatus Magasanikbacteria bacterium]|nr:HAD family phosphatase [Candidatus Magasanikbacteria bacterium]
MQNQKINTFIFDCFGVILKPFIGGWHKDKREKYGLVDENLESTLKKFDLGQLSEDNLLDYFLNYDIVTLSKEDLRNEIDSYLEIDHNLVRIIQNLRKQDFKVGLLSNANHTFFDRKVFPTYPDFKSLFDEIVISSIVGMIKPEDDIYLHALQKLNVKPEEAIFIDDAEANVKTAIKLGIGGYVYTDAASFGDYLRCIDVSLE